MSELRTRMDNDMIIRGLADRTRKSYLAAVTGLAKYYQRPPDKISEQEVQAYLLHMIKDRGLSWSTCNLTVAALRFLYHTTLSYERGKMCVPAAKRPRRLPEILSRQQIVRLIEQTESLKHRAIFMLAYGAGLRVSELCHLRVCDIDAELMSIRVNYGKGAKDRYTLLSSRLLEQLRSYWRLYRPRPWMFPARGGDKPMDISTAQRAYQHAKQRARITKRGGIHGLRHAFATHLMEAGTDLHTIQRLLGHSHIRSTMRYLHLAHGDLVGRPSPLDLLELPRRQTS